MPPQVSCSKRVITHSHLVFGQVGFQVNESEMELGNADALLSKLVAWAVEQGLCQKGERVLVMHGTVTLDTEKTAQIKVLNSA